MKCISRHIIKQKTHVFTKKDDSALFGGIYILVIYFFGWAKFLDKHFFCVECLRYCQNII